MKWILRLLVNAAALWAAVKLVPGLSYEGGPLPLLGVALIFGVVNTIVKPILTILSLPFVIVTLGLFLLVINALMLWLTSGLAKTFGLGFHVDGFGSAFLGAIVVGLVAWGLSIFIKDREPR